jgi:nitroreductase
MNTLDAIHQRLSIKQFDPEHRLTRDEEKALFVAAIQSPTSFNIQHWRFVIGRDA